MKVTLTHPQIVAMIKRRSQGLEDYTRGVRWYLLRGLLQDEQVTDAFARGYVDAHDMCSYLRDLAADLQADDFPRTASQP